jgi:Ca-activated chloride channel homolog
MSFGAPLFLLGFLVLPLVAWAWWERRRRPPRYAVRYTAVSSLREAVAADGGGASVLAWRRWLPGVLLLASLAALVVALARPRATVAVPIERATIMLVTDHSRSMEADDVSPDRLAAAQKAASTFLDQLPGPVRAGVVTFSSAPDAVVAPTTDRTPVRRVIGAQFPDGATATGDALQVAVNSIVAQTQKGKRPPAAIVLLSDGKTTTGRDPIGVAIAAKRLHIPIYTVALGTDHGVVEVPGFGGFVPVPPDPQSLGEIAQESGGRAFTARNTGHLSSIYKKLGSQLGTKKRKHETTASFAVAGLVLLLGAGLASVRFTPALP